MIERDFPGGYFGCCGMSRARGHAELCQAAQAIETAKPPRRETGSARKGESAVPSGMRPSPIEDRKP